MKRKVKFVSVILLAAGVFFMFISCASKPGVTHAEMDAGVQEGAFDEVLVQLDTERSRPARGRDRSTAYSTRNEVLFYLDRGMIAHYAGLYQESFENLERAEQLIEEAFTRSVSQDIASLIVNDNMRDYSGESYEDLYVNVFNALNRYHLNDLQGAVVEVRRLNEKLSLLADRHQRAVERVKESNDKLDTTNIEASRFSNSALARYLGILFYRAIGNRDGVRIEHEELEQAFRLAPEIYANPIPSSVREELSVPPDMARLNVIAFTGLSPLKEEENVVIPLPFPPPQHEARIALPVLVSRPQTITRVEVVLSTGEKFDLQLLEDIGAVAKETFKSSYALTVLRSTARAIARTTAVAASAAAAGRRGGEAAGLATRILGRVLSEAAENADTRISRYFPNYALVGGINLEPGTYMMTINFYGARGLMESHRREVSVQSNVLNLEQFINISET